MGFSALLADALNPITAPEILRGLLPPAPPSFTTTARPTPPHTPANTGRVAVPGGLPATTPVGGKPPVSPPPKPLPGLNQSGRAVAVCA